MEEEQSNQSTEGSITTSGIQLSNLKKFQELEKDSEKSELKSLGAFFIKLLVLILIITASFLAGFFYSQISIQEKESTETVIDPSVKQVDDADSYTVDSFTESSL